MLYLVPDLLNQVLYYQKRLLPNKQYELLFFLTTVQQKF